MQTASAASTCFILRSKVAQRLPLGLSISSLYPDEVEAGVALEAIARVKRRRGYQDL
ncbi:hypothetical protein [Microvirga sp. KLBC 81]|uniref:hypothetical protein n=1 Tax=Microvirga sp. KLBC 81 TaxID=1862707 RepID=UPI001402CA21|nr:hypothetical protein [Microvirga sp. KLBC 81]